MYLLIPGLIPGSRDYANSIPKFRNCTNGPGLHSLILAYLTFKLQSICRRFRDRTNGSFVINDVSCSRSSSTSSSSAAAAAGGLRQRKVYIKKPLNAFMLFMKEMRQKVIDECTLKESAAINQILGRKVR